MLKQLFHGALLPLTQLLTEMERTGRSPGQWRVVKFATLAKKADIERPIGLCDVVYKAWLQVRFSLVPAWMKKYAAVAPWNAARPGCTCLSVSIHRLFQAELAKVNHQCRVTLFLDLSTFYETISHQRLEQTAYELEYPATLLNIGARVLSHLLLARCGGRVPHSAQPVQAGPALSVCGSFQVRSGLQP